nr:MAG TPA: hypothetical protein [Caudoviricetes sp.]
MRGAIVAKSSDCIKFTAHCIYSSIYSFASHTKFVCQWYLL